MVASRWFSVLTPEFTWVEVVDPEIGGPSYSGRDWLLVQAHTAREALTRAVKHWRRQREGYVQDQITSGLCPFTGIKATVVPPAELAEYELTGDAVLPLAAKPAEHPAQ